jgi:hypothetical protein
MPFRFNGASKSILYGYLLQAIKRGEKLAKENDVKLLIKLTQSVKTLP